MKPNGAGIGAARGKEYCGLYLPECEDCDHRMMRLAKTRFTSALHPLKKSSPACWHNREEITTWPGNCSNRRMGLPFWAVDGILRAGFLGARK